MLHSSLIVYDILFYPAITIQNNRYFYFISDFVNSMNFRQFLFLNFIAYFAVWFELVLDNYYVDLYLKSYWFRCELAFKNPIKFYISFLFFQICIFQMDSQFISHLFLIPSNLLICLSLYNALMLSKINSEFLISKYHIL